MPKTKSGKEPRFRSKETKRKAEAWKHIHLPKYKKRKRGR